MVAALYSSKLEKTKHFLYLGINFGWSAIEMFACEGKQAEAGVPRRVPGMRESYMYRDIRTSKAWQDHAGNASLLMSVCNRVGLAFVCVCEGVKGSSCHRNSLLLHSRS